MKRTQLKTGAKSTERGSTFASRGEALKRTPPTTRARRPISPASSGQRSKVRDATCRECHRGPVDPAHVIARSVGGCDDPLCVIALCRTCHRAYDEGDLDVLPLLSRDEQAHAVAHVGLITAICQITNLRWMAKEAA